MFETQFIQLIDGEMSDEQGTFWLREQSAQPVNGHMLATAAQVMRQRMIQINYPGPLLDTCGTGGDQQSTLNISTAAALVLAAAGVKVAKHGNRAVSSTSGSTDVLSALGINADQPEHIVIQCLDQFNLGFCFAPRFHPRLKALAPIRKQLGIPTILNFLGPLCNPCRPQYQLLGVGKRHMLRPMAEALMQLQIEHAAVVHGEPGLDEVSLSGPTDVCLIEHGRISETTWTVEDFGFTVEDIESIRCKDATGSAKLIEAILQGEDAPGRPWVLVNVAAGLVIRQMAKTLRDGVHRAEEVVRSGQAWRCLQQWQQCCAPVVRPSSMS